jgi:dTDP-4-dehydrorhamnose reductase
MAGPRILLLGSTGQVGWELQRTLAPLGELVAARRGLGGELAADLTDLGGIERLLDAVQPTLIVNAAAYTAVDQAESQPELAERVNGAAPGVIGEWAQRRGAAVLHYSTDYVFDGSQAAPYRETDTANPGNVYGRSKLAGEQALLASGAAALILRVSWVYSRRGRNFLRTMQRLMSEREQLRIVDDQVGAPTWSRLIAEATAIVLGKLNGDAGAIDERRGVYHLAPAGATSWYGFARRIREAGGYGCRLEPISTAEYPTPAQRPLNSRLDTHKLAQVFGLQLPDWEQGFRLCIEDAETGT